MNDFKSDQEDFWAGEFGTDYISRNNSQDYLAANLHFFGEILSKTNGISSVMEFGPNIGMNLKAISLLLPQVQLGGVEINSDANNALKSEFPDGNFFNQSIVEYKSTEKYDLCLIKGVLIHLNPDLLQVAYQKIYESAKKYVLIAEYYDRSPVTVEYRGHSDRLFKRDFAGEFLQQYPDFILKDYGFIYHADANFPQDDVTWFLMEKYAV
ncbi:MAG: pseudaminic acid biosynthesis-associated methylase [Legionellales bacterium]|mgnify:CR=1 FL=1|nr:pseudaminic acid biosynthesis-associated methylase [Legionellales bacterium]|tara:strand:- start:4518 stop:5147 length:630 start_codon:yes stop_codon:yes gene_type:complete